MASSATPDSAKSHEFKAEIKQLLDILIHSVYTAKDIFVRELISNATDALEKARFCQAAGRPLHSPEAPLEIRIETTSDDDVHRLVISDSGIGMTLDEVGENIGTIAHSGATAFVEQFKDDAQAESDVSLIGRFGVGFYSVFMAAERVLLTTRSAEPDAKAVRWSSNGLGSYEVEETDDDAPRGTRIEIQLKDAEKRFAEELTVKEAIKRYSNFVPFAIFVNDEQVNQTKALWREPESQVSDEEYNEFFKLISHDVDDPILRLHYSVDAPIQFSTLLFIPAINPEMRGFGEGKVSLQLYTRRVLIDGENKDLLPRFLRFVKGVVESEDLPLNISRETLQENRIITKIREQLTKQLLDAIAKMAEDDPEQYARLWRNFGRVLKEGCMDFSQQPRLNDLLRFNSSRHDDAEGLLGLADYVDAMPEGQKAIYYLSGPSRDALLHDARLELFRKQGVEMLYLTDPSDEFALERVGQYREKDLVSADQARPEDLKDLSGEADDDKPSDEAAEKEKPDVQVVIDRFKEILGERVIDVRASERLVGSPACLVGDDSQPSGHMDRMFRMMNKDGQLPQRVLELNSDHALIRDLARLAEKDAQDPFIQRACEQLFEGAMLVDGYLTDPHQLVERMNQVLEDAAGLKAEK